MGLTVKCDSLLSVMLTFNKVSSSQGTKNPVRQIVSRCQIVEIAWTVSPASARIIH